MIVIINGLAVNYEKSGSGPVILLLHGWGDTNQTFKELTKILKSNFTVIALDLPGFGGSDAPQQAYDLEKYAQFVAEFLVKIDQRYIYSIIGHSNGGAIAIKALASGIIQANNLVLLASSGVRSTYSSRKKALRIAAKTIKYPTKLLPGQIQQKLKKKAYRTIGSDLFVAEHLQDTFKLVVSEDLVHESAMITQKTLLIYGSIDKATPVDYGERFQKQIEGSKLIVIENADHFLHITHASEVNQKIKEFLEQK